MKTIQIDTLQLLFLFDDIWSRSGFKNDLNVFEDFYKFDISPSHFFGVFSVGELHIKSLLNDIFLFILIANGFDIVSCSESLFLLSLLHESVSGIVPLIVFLLEFVSSLISSSKHSSSIQLLIVVQQTFSLLAPSYLYEISSVPCDVFSSVCV